MSNMNPNQIQDFLLENTMFLWLMIERSTSSATSKTRQKTWQALRSEEGQQEFKDSRAFLNKCNYLLPGLSSKGRRENMGERAG